MIKAIYLVITILLISPVSSFASKLENMFNEHTSIQEPFKLRDPFQIPKFKSQEKKQREQRFNGLWENVPKLDFDMGINEIYVTGVLIGKERRVLIQKNGSGPTFRLKEEDTIGPNGPKIKAILPGGIILVEQITNIYEEAEYIETVIPISK